LGRRKEEGREEGVSALSFFAKELTMRFVTSNLFDSWCQTLVNPVNTEGVMGTGLAQAFRARYPEMFRAYRERCRRGDFSIGSLMLWRGPDRWVLNLPTKTSWRLASELDYVRQGLLQFRAEYHSLGIRSIAFPALGCGRGQLAWASVQPLFEEILHGLPIYIYVHLPR
jgi:O-acetyl-ADP-ribose deacetylase (regulator of RNase III)